jgi:hypothetical protein
MRRRTMMAGAALVAVPLLTMRALRPREEDFVFSEIPGRSGVPPPRRGPRIGRPRRPLRRAPRSGRAPAAAAASARGALLRPVRREICRPAASPSRPSPTTTVPTAATSRPVSRPGAAPACTSLGTSSRFSGLHPKLPRAHPSPPISRALIPSSRPGSSARPFSPPTPTSPNSGRPWASTPRGCSKTRGARKSPAASMPRRARPSLWGSVRHRLSSSAAPLSWVRFRMTAWIPSSISNERLVLRPADDWLLLAENTLGGARGGRRPPRSGTAYSTRPATARALPPWRDHAFQARSGPRTRAPGRSRADRARAPAPRSRAAAPPSPSPSPEFAVIVRMMSEISTSPCSGCQLS